MININTAIILFTHRRPLHTYKILKILKLINLKKIYIVSDGWRNNEEKKQVLIVRDLVIKSNYSFKVNKFFLDRNIGIRNIFKIGLDWVFKYEKKIIVLEDDTVPNKSFFKFCDTLLIKYKDNKKISMICGTNFKSSLTQKNAESYFFSKYTFIWGWATWKDRWTLYDNKLKKWDKFKKNKSINKHFSNPNEIKFWKKNFEYLKKNPNKGAWDFPLTFANFYHKRISIVPKVNLITNIGYDDPSGHNPKKNSNLKKINIKFPLEHPQKLKTSNEYDNYCSKKVFSIPSFNSRILNKIKKYLNY